MLTTQGPVYIAEISTPKLRGRLISFQQWMITWGILIMYFVSYGASFINSSTATFRVPWGLQMVPAWVLMVATRFMPRSPRWLAAKDRWEEATETLARLHAHGDTMSPLIIAELQEIKEKIQYQPPRLYSIHKADYFVRLEHESRNASWFEIFKPRYIIRTHCAAFTHIWSQLTGTNVMMYYIVYIFEMAGLTGNQNLLSASIQYIIVSSPSSRPDLLANKHDLECGNDHTSTPIHGQMATPPGDDGWIIPHGNVALHRRSYYGSLRPCRPRRL